MAPRRRDPLRPDEIIRQTLALFPRQQFLQAGHVFVLLVFDVGVEVFEEGVEGWDEGWGGGGKGLEGVEVFFYLFGG